MTAMQQQITANAAKETADFNTLQAEITALQGQGGGTTSTTTNTTVTQKPNNTLAWAGIGVGGVGVGLGAYALFENLNDNSSNLYGPSTSSSGNETGAATSKLDSTYTTPGYSQ